MKALVVGISGVSSSGKTTLARLLRDIWPNTSILHEDDFYWPDNEIPVKNGIQDWDCLEALDLAKLESILKHIKNHGGLPEDWTSKEDQNSVGECSIETNTIQKWKTKAQDLCQHLEGYHIVIIDGFLLYSEQMEKIWRLLDVKLMTRLDYETTKKRREARSGYVTIEGFWEDPPGYVENVVWPNFVKEHSFLFENNNVEGDLNEVAQQKLNLRVMPREAQDDMTKCLEWACSVLQEYICRNSE